VKGYVLHGAGHAGWAEVGDPRPGPYDAVVRPVVVAVCTTDVHLIATAVLPAAVGKPIGHEAVGVVEQVGDLVSDFRPGQRVIIPAGASDWRSPKAQCGEAKYYQTNNPYFNEDPTVTGVFCEAVRVRDADLSLAHIPDEVSDVQAVMVPDMVATGMTGVEKLRVKFGDTVAVLGAGPVGLMGIAGAALAGAARIIAVDSRERTAGLALAYGATDRIDHTKGPVPEQLFALTGGRPVDGVLVAAGGDPSDLITTALRIVKPGGHVANVSAYLEAKSITIPVDVIGYGTQDKALTGVFVKDGRDFLERMLALVRYGRIDPLPLVSHQLHGWGQLEGALALMRERDPSVIKPVVLV
jgi:threonine dehydrogenase-like Zn-dependent dehydrogenase